MALRFWRRLSLFPGLNLNLSKTGASLSAGPRGAKYTVGTSGRRSTVSLPGTGLYYTARRTRRAGKRPSATEPEAPDGVSSDPAGRLDLGFFRRLVTPAGERALVDGLKAMVAGDETAAIEQFEQAPELTDARWLAGMLRLKREHFRAAERHLEAALARAGELGGLLDKYGVVPTTSLRVTPELTAHIQPRARGTRLALAEVYQVTDQLPRALECIERLHADQPDDPVVTLSLVELLLDTDPTAHASRVVALTAGVENESPVHAALLLYKIRALRELGLNDAAFRTGTAAYRRKKDRDPELLRHIRYERALAYEAVGKRSRSRSELEAIYAEAPDFADVGERLGI